jgi:hypothetical protein
MAAVPPGVPPVVQAAVAAAQEAAYRQEVLFLLARCGIDAVNTERCFCGVEGFCRPEDFALMTIDEVPKLAKRMEEPHDEEGRPSTRLGPWTCVDV